MKCFECKKEVEHTNSLNVSDKTTCIQCAYDIFPKGSPGRKHLEMQYGLSDKK